MSSSATVASFTTARHAKWEAENSYNIVEAYKDKILRISADSYHQIHLSTSDTLTAIASATLLLDRLRTTTYESVSQGGGVDFERERLERNRTFLMENYLILDEKDLARDLKVMDMVRKRGKGWSRGSQWDAKALDLDDLEKYKEDCEVDWAKLQGMRMAVELALHAKELESYAIEGSNVSTTPTTAASDQTLWNTLTGLVPDPRTKSAGLSAFSGNVDLLPWGRKVVTDLISEAESQKEFHEKIDRALKEAQERKKGK